MSDSVTNYSLCFVGEGIFGMKTRIEISRGLTPISHVAKQLPIHLFFEDPMCLSPSRFASVMREMATGRPSILLALFLQWLFPRFLSFDPHTARGRLCGNVMLSVSCNLVSYKGVLHSLLIPPMAPTDIEGDVPVQRGVTRYSWNETM